MPKKYSEEQRKEIITTYQSGLPVATICEKYHVAPSTIYRWLKDVETAPIEAHALSPDIRKLAFHKERLEHILEIIQLSTLIDEVPLRRRLDILEELHEHYEKYNIYELCEALHVARGTFYNHIFRRADRSKYQEERQALMLRVQQIFDDSNQRFGAEKIRVILSDSGIHVGKKRIREIM